MSKMQKVGTQLEAAVLKELRAHAKESGKSLSSILSEAAQMYLKAKRVSPVFLKATQKSIDRYDELYKRLSK